MNEAQLGGGLGSSSITPVVVEVVARGNDFPAAMEKKLRAPQLAINSKAGGVRVELVQGHEYARGVADGRLP